jgi:molecular chaperone DnaK (HSP70)
MQESNPSLCHYLRYLAVAVGSYAAQSLLLRRRIRSNVENAKMRLSTVAKANVEFPGSAVDSLELTMSEMALALHGITTRTAVKITEVVMKAVGKIENIDFVVLSGGSSLNPVVQQAITSIFRHIPKERFVLPDPGSPQDVETCICAVVKRLALLRMDGFSPIDFGD